MLYIKQSTAVKILKKIGLSYKIRIKVTVQEELVITLIYKRKVSSVDLKEQSCSRPAVFWEFVPDVVHRN